MNVEEILEYVKKNGTEMDLYRIEYLFYGKKDDAIPLNLLAALQNADGGFPYNTEKGNASRLSETSVQFTLLRELDLLKTDLGKRTVNYLVSTQKSDGRWSENPEIAQYDPPPWNMPGDLKSDMWLTAEMALHLLPLGYRKEAKKAAQFLARHRENDKLVGYELATVLGASLFSSLGEERWRESIEKKAQEIVEKEEEPAFLTWYIGAMELSELSFKNELVGKSLAKLHKKLEAEDGERGNIPPIIESLKLLKKYERM
jgi:hypothetical protein